VNLLVILFVFGFVAIGYVSTYLMAVPLRFEERVFFGVIIGTVTISLVGFVLAWVMGVDGMMVLITMGVCAAGSTPALYWHASSIRDDAVDFGVRLKLPWKNKESPKPLLGIFLVSTIVTTRIMQNAYGVTSDGGISAGHLSVFGDWSAHLSYTASFAFADNFPPDLPTAAGESFSYHFGVDWFSAMFVPLGSSLLGALEISTAVLAITFPVVMYITCKELCTSRLGAALATFVFLTAGGTSALYRFLFEDLPDNGSSVLGNLPRSYAFDGFDRNWVDNPVTGFLYPQRPTLIGFSSALIVILLLWLNREKQDSKTYCFAGLITGFLPVFHVFAFGVLLLIGLTWAIMERVKGWMLFLFPSLLLGLPVLLWQLPERNGHEWHFFWMLGRSSWEQTPLDFLQFWFLNTGLFIPISICGAILTVKKFGYRFIPIFFLLIIPNVAIWHFWPGNNAKYVVFFLLLAAPLVGETLSRLFGGGRLRIALASLVLVSLSLSGTLDIWRAFEGTSTPYPVGYLSGADVLVGEWIRDNTKPDAVFASANTNTHPVRTLAGRTVISGSPGRLNDLGIDWYTRDQDLKNLYSNAPDYDKVIRRYQVDYVIIGPYERDMYLLRDSSENAENSYSFERDGNLIYDFGGYQIYEMQGKNE
jgi:hypothetical protein